MRLSTELEDVIEWSIRKEGTTIWDIEPRGRSFHTAADSNTDYELVVGPTTNNADDFDCKISMSRATRIDDMLRMDSTVRIILMSLQKVASVLKSLEIYNLCYIDEGE
jgi:hypothetical protein